jgi:hypothetical protein
MMFLPSAKEAFPYLVQEEGSGETTMGGAVYCDGLVNTINTLSQPSSTLTRHIKYGGLTCRVSAEKFLDFRNAAAIIGEKR